MKNCFFLFFSVMMKLSLLWMNGKFMRLVNVALRVTDSASFTVRSF